MIIEHIIPLDLMDFDFLKEKIQAVIEIMEQNKKELTAGTMAQLYENIYFMNIEIYLLGEVLYKIKNRELKLERTNREDVKVKFTQTEIDVIVKCLGMYAGQALAKIDSKRMYVSFKIKHDFLT